MSGHFFHIIKKDTIVFVPICTVYTQSVCLSNIVNIIYCQDTNNIVTSLPSIYLNIFGQSETLKLYSVFLLVQCLKTLSLYNVLTLYAN